MIRQSEARFLRGAGLSVVPFLRERRWMLLLFCLAFVIRAVYVIPQAKIPTINDMGVYDQLAANMLSGRGYISQLEPHFQSWRAPGYPFFLLVVYFTFGHHALPVLLLQSLLGALTCTLIYLIGRESFGQKIGLIAGLICAVDPEMIHWTAKMLTETLFIFLLTLLVLLCLRLSKSRRRSLAVGAGLVLGYAALVRPNILLLIPFLVLHFLFFVEGTIQKRIMLAIVPPVVCALVMLPWIVRNYLIQGEFVPVATLMGGVSLFDAIPPSDEMIEAAEYHGLKQFADDKDWEYLERSAYVLPNGYDLVPELFGQASPDQLPPDFDETEQSRLGYRRFFEYVRQDPVRYGKLVLTKLSLTFSIIPKQYSAEIGEDYGFGRFNVAAKLYSIVFLTVTFVLGSLGVIVTFRKRGPTILFDSVLLYHIVMQLIFRPASRYFLPGLVIASLFTASGLEALRGLRLLLSREHPRTVIRLRIWGASVLLFVLNTFYQVILQWEKIMQYWDHLVTRLI